MKINKHSRKETYNGNYNVIYYAKTEAIERDLCQYN